MQGLMQLSPAGWFEDPLANKAAVVRDLLAASSLGIQLDAPTLVEIETRSTLPMIAMRVWENHAVPRLEFKRAALLTAVDQRTGYVHVAPAFDLGARGRGASRPRPPEEPLPEGMNALPYTIDARARLSLPWEPSELLLTIVAREQVSDRARVKLDLATPDEERARDEREREANAPLPAIHPPPDEITSSYVQRPASPEIPAKHGIAFVVDRIHVMEPDAHLFLHGSFRVPVGPARLITRERWEAAAHETRWQIVPTAMVPITLVVTGTEVTTPYVFRLWVPSFDAPDQIARANAITGYFSFDLRRLADVAGVAQTLFLYAFSGELLTGPILTACVAPSSLPG